MARCLTTPVMAKSPSHQVKTIMFMEAMEQLTTMHKLKTMGIIMVDTLKHQTHPMMDMPIRSPTMSKRSTRLQQRYRTPKP